MAFPVRSAARDRRNTTHYRVTPVFCKVELVEPPLPGGGVHGEINTVPAPKVSIITATYNCSHILRYAINSVLNSGFRDWELIVVGDHCTDDTQECVASFNDDRIRFSTWK